MTFVFSDTADYKQYLVTEHPIKKVCVAGLVFTNSSFQTRRAYLEKCMDK